jgi:hypothetical protein
LVVFAAVVVAGLLAPAAGAGAGVWADIRDMLASAKAMVNTVVFILFSPAGLFVSRSQSHLAADSAKTR